MTPLSTAPHLEESELLHLVDRDVGDGDLARWGDHARACAACADRLARLRRRTEHLSTLLQGWDVPASFPSAEQTMRAARRPRAAVPVWLRAAAVIALLLLPFALVAPLRAMVVEWAQSGAARVVALFHHSPAAEPPPPAASSGFVLRFTPASDELTLRFATTQRAGTLILTSTPDADASLEISHGAGEVPLVMESELRVQNRSESIASYRIALPLHLRRVRVVVGADRPILLTPNEVRGERIIPLH